MKNIYILLAFLVTFSVQSQRNPESTYMSTFAYKAKDGMVDKFEKAVAKKTKMFNLLYSCSYVSAVTDSFVNEISHVACHIFNESSTDSLKETN